MLVAELALIFVLILINSALAMSELAVVSARPARLKTMIERGVRGSRRALALASDPGRFLSTVQVGITLVGILAGAVSGATLGARLSGVLSEAGMDNDWADPIAFGLVVTAITYFSLIVGELVPKQIALKNPEAIACAVAPAMMFLSRIASPFVWLLDVSGRLLLALLGQRRTSQARVTEEEIKMLISEAETAGVIESEERDMIAGVMRLGDRPVSAVMTPRHQVDMIDLTDEAVDVAKAIKESFHSRLPVSNGTPDEVIGIIQAKDIVDVLIAGKKLDLRKLVTKAPVIPDTMLALDVVELLKGSSIHIGLVHDEYGHFQGVVTSSDILEAIVGTFRSEDEDGPHAVQRDDGSWLISGSMPVDEFVDLLAIRLPEKRPYQTVGGFVLERLKHLPALGESFSAKGWKFEVVDLDGRRVDKVLAVKQPVSRRVAERA
jgi:putative hemolysin